MARALVAGSVPSTAVGSPIFSASVPCHIPDGFPVYKPKHGSGFLRAQLLLQVQRPSRVIALVAPSALYCRSLSSSYSVQAPRSAGCLRLGLSNLHGFGWRRSPQEPRLAGGDSFETQASSPRCMAASIEKDLEKWIKETNSSEPVVVWSKTYCPYSIRVKKLFDKLGYNFQAVELDEIAEEGLQDALERVSGLSTVPNVYIGGKHIGGCDDTVTLHMRSELVPLLTAAGANKK
ncbi:hypothetical protein BDL97_10G064000 [Sphagnum fallax]|nr:hypothetical protein BDL97_10G064000 [Sphagnum fallax]